MSNSRSVCHSASGRTFPSSCSGCLDVDWTVCVWTERHSLQRPRSAFSCPIISGYLITPPLHVHVLHAENSMVCLDVVRVCLFLRHSPRSSSSIENSDGLLVSPPLSRTHDMHCFLFTRPPPPLLFGPMLQPWDVMLCKTQPYGDS